MGGFLYSKFSKADEKNIETDYQISINPKKKVNVNISEDNDMINISVDNISPFISSEEMMTFFHRGVSTKAKTVCL